MERIPNMSKHDIRYCSFYFCIVLCSYRLKVHFKCSYHGKKCFAVHLVHLHGLNTKGPVWNAILINATRVNNWVGLCCPTPAVVVFEM